MATSTDYDTVSSSSSSQSEDTSLAKKKQAWNKPLNDHVQKVEENPVMGALSWPALSSTFISPTKPSVSQVQVMNSNATPNHTPIKQQSVVSQTSPKKETNNHPRPQRPRRDHHHRSFNNTRDAQIHPRRLAPPPSLFIRPPPPPFLTPPPIPPFPAPLYYVPPLRPRPMPFIHAPPPPPPMFFHAPPDPNLASRLLTQIDYYFSSENLCKDTYLRQNMDEQGWVHVSVIASFNRVKQLTTNIQFILDAIKISTVVEVQGERIRKRGDWMHWLLSPFNKSSPVAGSRSPSFPNYDMLANRIKNIRLEEAKAPNQVAVSGIDRRREEILSRLSSEDLNKQSLYKKEANHQVLDRSTPRS